VFRRITLRRVTLGRAGDRLSSLFHRPRLPPVPNPCRDRAGGPHRKGRRGRSILSAERERGTASGCRTDPGCDAERTFTAGPVHR